MTTRVVVAGGRDFADYALMESALVDVLSRRYPKVTIVSGCAKGADSLALEFAGAFGLPIERYPAKWDTHGKSAGMIRNKAMAEVADIVVVFWDGKSRGSHHMIQQAMRQRKELHVYYYEPSVSDRPVMDRYTGL